eukprot:scaffold51202_cov65-Phaeocystis_antarctica.AAC.8
MGWREGLGELTGFGGYLLVSRISWVARLKAQNSPRVAEIRARCRMCLESSVCTDLPIDNIC